MNTLIIILCVVVVMLIAGIIFMVMSNQQAEKKKRVMQLIQGQSFSAAPQKNEADEQNKRRAEIAKKLKDNESDEKKQAKNKKKVTLNLMFGRAGLSITAKTYWIMSFVSGVVFFLGAKFFGLHIMACGFIFFVGFLGFPKFILSRMAKKRQKKFLEEFPDALEAMVRLLKAGMPVAEAVIMISKEYTGPVGEEMTRIYDKQKIGIPLHEAAAEATLRMPLTEVQMFATGLAIQAQTGSSLSEVLQNLSNVIRSRFRLKRKIKALSSEAIASASIIGALPILVAGGMYFANREYIMVLFDSTMGILMLSGAVFWMGVGIVSMKIMINFKI